MKYSDSSFWIQRESLPMNPNKKRTVQGGKKQPPKQPPSAHEIHSQNWRVPIMFFNAG